MNRAFDDVLRSFNVMPFGSDHFLDDTMGWPHIEVSETDKEVKVNAELPGLEEKDVEVELAKGVLAIRGEKKTEVEDKERLFSEREAKAEQDRIIAKVQADAAELAGGDPAAEIRILQLAAKLYW